MKETLKEFYNPDYDSLWQNCVFVFDTSVLLNLYRLKDETKDAFFKVIEKIEDRKWIPYLVGFEYHKNRHEVINEIKSENLTEENEKHLQDLEKSLNLFFKRTKNSDGDETRTKQLIGDIKKIIHKCRKKADDKYNNLTKHDYIQEKVTMLFKNKIGQSFSKKELEELYKIGEKRYAEKTPPGYMDIKNKEGNDIYSDFIIWQEIIKFAKTNNKCVVFVTADEKEDWWHIHRGKKSCCPKLKKEFYEEAGTEFHMYMPERFLAEANKFFGLDYSDEIIEEVKQIRRPLIHNYSGYPLEIDKESQDIEEFQKISVRKILRNKLINSSSDIDFAHSISDEFSIRLISPIARLAKDTQFKFEQHHVIEFSALDEIAGYIIRKKNAIRRHLNFEQFEEDKYQKRLFNDLDMDI